MVTKNIVHLLLIVATVSGCATTHSSLGKRTSKGIELIAASESEVLSAAFEAISRKFPAANINKLSGYQTGFSWFHQPILDRTTFKFNIAERKGVANDGLEVVGYSYSINTYGSQWAVDARYVKPLIKEFKTILSERSIKKIYVENVTFKRSYEQNVNFAKSGQTDSIQHVIEGTKEKYIVSQYWAVIVGVSEYHDSRIPALRYASNDARAFYEWIISPKGGRHSPVRVKLLINKDATGSNIKYALFDWLGQVLEEDLVTIYFAGHGTPQSPDHPKNLFLLPFDTQYDKISTTGFPMWDIETALKRFIKAQKIVVIADACHSGGIGQSYEVARRASRSIDVNPISCGLQNLSQIGDGVCVISASDEKQLSQESQKWGGHGVFTYFLLRGLQGEADYNKNTRVTLGELIPYLSEQVRRATRNAQSPTVAGKFDPSLSIGK